MNSQNSYANRNTWFMAWLYGRGFNSRISKLFLE